MARYITGLSDKESIRLKAMQGWSGSKEAAVKDGEEVEIKTNPHCIAKFYLFLISVFQMNVTQGFREKIVFGSIGIVGFLFIFAFSFRNYYVLHVKRSVKKSDCS